MQLTDHIQCRWLILQEHLVVSRRFCNCKLRALFAHCWRQCYWSSDFGLRCQPCSKTCRLSDSNYNVFCMTAISSACLLPFLRVLSERALKKADVCSRDSSVTRQSQFASLTTDGCGDRCRPRPFVEDAVRLPLTTLHCPCCGLQQATRYVITLPVYYRDWLNNFLNVTRKWQTSRKLK